MITITFEYQISFSLFPASFGPNEFFVRKPRVGRIGQTEVQALPYNPYNPKEMYRICKEEDWQGWKVQLGYLLILHSSSKDKSIKKR